MLIIVITVIFCYNLVNFTTPEKSFSVANVCDFVYFLFFSYLPHTHTHQPPSGKVVTCERSGSSSATNCAMGKWMSLLDSAHQIGPETTLKGFLIVVGTWSTVE